MSFYLGIDIGTFESKGVLVDGEGQVAATCTRPHKMIVPQPGWAEHRALEDWWADFSELTQRLVKDAGANPKNIRAVALSAIGPCMLPIDEEGEPLMNGVLYGVDTRAAKEIQQLTERLGAEKILAGGGNALTSQSVGPKILWLRRNRPDLFSRTAKIHTSTSFLVYRLIGKHLIDHHTACAFSPLYDADGQQWSAEMAEGIIDIGLLPEIAWTTEIAGELTQSAAAETRLAAGTPVTVGTIDAAAEAISVGVRRSGDMMLMYGSTIFIIELTDRRIADSRLWYAPWLFKGQHAAMAGLATSGTLTHWFRDNFAGELSPEEAFSVLAHEAESAPPGANGLVVLPYFSGERTPIHDPHARGCIFGLNLAHRRADVYRALLEGIAYGTAHIIETYAEIGQGPESITAVGGGIKNHVWSQATSDVSRRKQLLREKGIGAAYGDAFLAAMALGEVGSDDINSWNPVVGEIAPDAAASDAYERQFAIFKQLYPRTKDLMRQLSGA